MATIAHSVLAGTEVHEPKGVAAASLGQVYVADGNGSGNWSGVGTSSFTGMISDFVWPVVQDGWLELDGSDINTATYSALYDVMTIQMTGTRVVSTPTITSLSSTANMRVGYYAFGTGIPSGTTIASIDSGTQITLSANVTSSGSAVVAVSPWLLNTGTIRLPDLSAAGRYRRSRTSTTAVGQTQADSLKSHTHTGTSDAGGSHSHTFSGNTGLESASHTHQYTRPTSGVNYLQGSSNPLSTVYPDFVNSTSSESTNHYHLYSGTTSTASAHQHTFTTDATGSTETRPLSIIVMTCVKT